MVCLCEGVSERKVRKAVEHGARSIAEVTDACRAGGCCGGCHATIDGLITEATRPHPARLSVA